MRTPSDAFVGLVLAGLLLVDGSTVTAFLSSGRSTLRLGRVGRTGAEDRVPIVVDIAVAGLAMPDAAGVNLADGVDSADPGRSGTVLIASFARFCAAIVSLIDGLGGTELVLRDRAWGFGAAAAVDGSSSLRGSGLHPSSSSSFCCLLSRANKILARLSAYITLKWFTALTIQIFLGKDEQMPNKLGAYWHGL